MPVSNQQLLPGVPLVESPIFSIGIEAAGLNPSEVEIARSLNEHGYAVIEFPDPEIAARAARIQAHLGSKLGVDRSDPASVATLAERRIQDAWIDDADVRAIAVNESVLALLGRLYGRETVPFQTLNFPVGTQQHPHTDAVHFSSVPERFMCGVWVALEDIHPDAGPLIYYPGSHKWPILNNAMIGRRGWLNPAESAQTPFEPVWRAMVVESGSTPAMFTPRLGQALIWTANLLHGGAPQTDPQRSRWSQVTHYYFKDCIYYTPAHSDEAFGRLDLRSIVNIRSGTIEPNRLLGEEPARPPRPRRRKWPWSRNAAPASTPQETGLPADFDEAAYRLLNPDVEAAGADPREHYRNFGQFEQRRYKMR